MVTRGRWQGKIGDGDQMYKLLVIRGISSGALMYSMLTKVNDSVLYT